MQILNDLEYQDLLMFYNEYGFDITTLDVGDKAISAHLIIAQIIVQNAPYTPDKFLEEISNGSLKEFFNSTLYEFDKFAQALQIVKGLNSGVDITKYWDASSNDSYFMMCTRLDLQDKKKYLL